MNNPTCIRTQNLMFSVRKNDLKDTAQLYLKRHLADLNCIEKHNATKKET